MYKSARNQNWKRYVERLAKKLGRTDLEAVGREEANRIHEARLATVGSYRSQGK